MSIVDMEGNPVLNCPSCDSIKFVIKSGEIICANCGLVLGEAEPVTDPEWRAFSREERDKRERTGAPISQSVHDKGLSTVVGKPRQGASKEERERAYRIKKWQVRTRIHSSSDRNLIQAMSELSRLCEKLSIPVSAREEGAVIYRQALDKDLVRGRSIAAIMAASLYAACRLQGLSRTLNNIAAESAIPKKDIARCFRLLIRELDLKMPVPNPGSKVSIIASKLGVTEGTRQLAESIIHRAHVQMKTAGKDPMGLAAAALYISCQLRGEEKTQKAIARAAGVTEVTIRNRYKGLKEAIRGVEDINEDFKDFMQEKPQSPG